jgi:ribonucleoside-diphosphate reductase subunit M2
MESPAKKLCLDAQADKENVADARYEADEVAVPIKGIPLLPEPAAEMKPAEAEGVHKEEEIEPILQENPQRFVLFPIKYHEVRVANFRVARRHA